ncbi:MAG: hypothetical protein ABW007_09190 [Chitinophagaceae bacterium]
MPGNIAVQGYSTGFDSYRLSCLGLAAGRKLGTKASLGIRANYHQLKISAYGAAAAISADAGLVLHLSEKLHTGIQLCNPFGSDLREGVYIPGMYNAGIGYDLSDQLYMSVEVLKEQSQTLNTILGIQYKPVPHLLIRLSVQTKEVSVVFGAGYTRSRLRIDLHSSYHLRLGMRSGIWLYWFWKKEDAPN